MKNKQTTIRDVAEKAGVSIATVSRALNKNTYVKKETYDAIMDAIRELSYKKNTKEEINRKRLILVLLPNIENLFYSKVIQGIQYAAAARGYDCFLMVDADVDAHYEKIIDIVHSLSPMGMIVLSPVLSPEVLQSLEACVPLVQCTEFTEHSDISFVSIDDYTCSKSLVEYIISKGKKRLAILNGPQKFKYSRERYRAFTDAIREAGLELNPQFVIHLPSIVFEPALSIATQLLNSPTPPDAFFCVSDIYAAAVVKAAVKIGISIPDELGVVGFDNTSVTTMCHPSITSINQPCFEMGFTACEILFEKISNPSAQYRHVFMDTELVIRESL